MKLKSHPFSIWSTVILHCSILAYAVEGRSFSLSGSSSSSMSSLSSQSAFMVSPPPSFHKRLRQLRGGAARASSKKTTTPTSLATPSTTSRTNKSSSTALLAYNESGTDAGSLSIKELFDVLRSSPTEGLTDEEAQRRLHQYGPNTLVRPPSKSVWQLILEQFEDRLVQILLVVALMSGVFSFLELRQQLGDGGQEALWKSFVEPLVILAILVLNAAVGVWQSQSASDSLEALQKLQPTLATVVRNGGTTMAEFDAATVVPGDILEIRVGDKIPADSRLLSLKSSSLKVDEGSLTGESMTVNKLPGDEGKVDPDSPVQDQRGMLYSGTMVTSGSGMAVVVQTGMETQFGKVRTFAKNII